MLSIYYRGGTPQPRNTDTYRRQSGDGYAIHVFESRVESSKLGSLASSWLLQRAKNKIARLSDSIISSVPSLRPTLLRTHKTPSFTMYVEHQQDKRQGVKVESRKAIMVRLLVEVRCNLEDTELVMF